MLVWTPRRRYSCSGGANVSVDEVFCCGWVLSFRVIQGVPVGSSWSSVREQTPRLRVCSSVLERSTDSFGNVEQGKMFTNLLNMMLLS